MELAITLLLVICELLTLIIGISVIDYLIKKNNKLKKELQISNTIKEDLTSIKVGDRAVYPDFGLIWKDCNEPFKVTYEVEVLEVTKDKVKINAISYTSQNKKANLPINKQDMLSYMQNKWVEKNKIEPIMDNSKKRDSIIDQILN